MCYRVLPNTYDDYGVLFNAYHLGRCLETDWVVDQDWTDNNAYG